MEKTGITIASIMIIEGETPLCVVAVGPDTDFVSTASDTGGFVVHLLGADHRAIADTFALIRPAPGGLFSSVAFTDTSWGPRLDDIPDVVGCGFVEAFPTGEQILVMGEIETLELSDLTEPLIHFRGGYRTL